MTEEQTTFYREQLDRCWPWLEKAVEAYGKTHTKADIWTAIEGGMAQFWPLPNAAMVTQIDGYGTGLKEVRMWLAGGDMAEILAMVPAIEDWARSKNCSRSVVIGRRGWLRAADGYQESATVMTKGL